jgi:hypothetical protein
MRFGRRLSFELEPRQPRENEGESLLVHAVQARSPLPFLLEEARALQDADMAADRRPSVVKPLGDVARRHAAPKVDGHEDLTPRGMSQRGEAIFERVETFLRRKLQS